MTGERASSTVDAGVTLKVEKMVLYMEHSRNEGENRLTTKAKQVNTTLPHRSFLVGSSTEIKCLVWIVKLSLLNFLAVIQKMTQTSIRFNSRMCAKEKKE